MSVWTSVWTCVCLLLVARPGAGSVTEPPEDTVGTVGDDVTFTCRVTGTVDRVRWLEYQSSGGVGRAVYSSSHAENGGILDPELVDKLEVAEPYDLTIRALELADGGYYACEFNDDLPVRGDLIVCDEPSLDMPTLVEGDVRSIVCSLAYTRASTNTDFHPELAALIGGAEQESVVAESEADGVHTVTRTVNYTAVSTDNDKNFTCRVSVPGTEFLLEHNKRMDVKYTVREVDYNPKNEFYYVGETINCTAKGNPEPEFRWEALRSDGSRPVSVAVLEITPNMVGVNQWRCQARNEATAGGIDTIQIDTPEFQVVAATEGPAPDLPPGGVSPGVVAAATIVPLVLVAALLAGAFFVWKSRKSKAADSGKFSDPSLGGGHSNMPPVMEEPEPAEGEDSLDLSLASDAYATPSSKPVNGRQQQGVPVFPVHPGTGKMVAPPGRGTPPAAAYPGRGTPPVAAYPGRNSPGYGDLGIRHFGGSSEGVDAAVSPSPLGAYQNVPLTPAAGPAGGNPGGSVVKPVARPPAAAAGYPNMAYNNNNTPDTTV